MESSAIAQGSVIDRYTVDSLLGEGGMAVVYRVRHNGLGTLHALKVLTMSSRQIRDRMRQEGQLQAKLQHPNIVAVTDVIEIDGAPGLIMEYIDGPTLDALIQRENLTEAQIDELAAGLFAGIGEAHKQGFIHRDLKPANVLLKITDQGLVPKVADFGLAKALGGSDPGHARTRTGSTMGTPHYMSPEQVRDAKNVGPRSDIFALGAILYEMVTGVRAFGGDDLLDIFNAIAAGRYKPVRELAPEAPARMVNAIESALQVSPDNRPATVEALAQLWRGDPQQATSAAPSGAFSQETLSKLRPQLDTAPVSAGEATWAAGTLVGQEPPKPSPRSTPAPGTVWAIGVGGTVLAVMIVAAAGLLFVGGGLWMLANRTDPVTAAAEPPKPVIDVLTPATIPEVEEAAEDEDGDPIVDGLPPKTATGDPSGDPALPAEPTPKDPGAPAPPGDPEIPPEVDPATGPPVAVLDPKPEGSPTDPEPAKVSPPQERPVPKGLELTPLLASADPDERKQGIDNLKGRANDKDACDLLDYMLREDREQSVRRHAWDTVKELYESGDGDVGLLERTIVYMMGARSVGLAIEAVRAYETRGTEPATMRRAFTHSEPSVRLAAIGAVPAVIARGECDARCKALLEPLREDEDEKVRKQAQKLSPYLD